MSYCGNAVWYLDSSTGAWVKLEGLLGIKVGLPEKPMWPLPLPPPLPLPVCVVADCNMAAGGAHKKKCRTLPQMRTPAPH